MRTVCRTCRLLAGLACLLPVALLAVPAVAQDEAASALPPPSPPGPVTATDRPWDAGGKIVVAWEASPDAARAGVSHYEIRRSEGGGPFEAAGTAPAEATSWVDSGGLREGVAYAYQVAAIAPGGEGVSSASGPAEARVDWFNKADRGNILIIMLLVCGAIVLYIERARAGQKLYIRKIAGMDAVTEAVGRATEMGQPVLYIAGIQDMDDVQTVAGITILGSISRMIAEYETQLLMPTSRSLVMSTARETVKESYLAAGRPDAYRDDSIYYVTDEQFGFVAHVDGLMVRKKPAACFYLGAFFAESLILAETGNSIGAIQVAGTAMPTQLPFFVAACDYTLIGEELFAASAYLSQDEKMLGSLKGQDFGKLVAMVFIVIGGVFSTLAAVTDAAPVAWVNEQLYALWGSSE
jgi:hypothetical protein